MKRRIIGLMTAVALLLPYGSNAASQRVNATLPDFKVHINGERVNNSLRQYPFILYKGITYFPMTYDDCEALGLEAKDTTADTMMSMLYRVDINTNATIQVSQLPINDFIIEGDTLFFIDRNTGNLYSKGLITGEEKLLVEDRVQQYAVYDDQVYFTTSEGLFKHATKGLRESISEDLKIESFKIQQEYFILQLHNDETYGLIILDSEGRDIYKTTDKIVSMSVENNLVVYTTYIDRNNYVLELPQ